MLSRDGDGASCHTSSLLPHTHTHSPAPRVVSLLRECVVVAAFWPLTPLLLHLHVPRLDQAHHVIVKAGIGCRVRYRIIQVAVRVTVTLTFCFVTHPPDPRLLLLLSSAILIGTPIVIGVTAYYFWPTSDAKAVPTSANAESKKIVKTAKIKPNTRNSKSEPVKLPPQVQAKNEGNVCFKVRPIGDTWKQV